MEAKSRAELSAFIESYWCSGADANEDFLLFPDGTFNVLFTAGTFSCNLSTRDFRPGMYIIPITTVPVRIRASQPLFGIRFKAFSMGNLFGVSLQNLNLISPMEEVYPDDRRIRQLCQWMLKCHSEEDTFMLLEAVSFELLCRNFHVNQSLRAKVNYILDQKGQIRVQEMADHFGISRQALHTQFLKTLKISPKQLCVIWQLNHFFTLTAESEENLTARALDAGFYDQAHFNNRFREIYNITPSHFVRLNHHMFSHARENMIRRFSNYYDPEV